MQANLAQVFHQEYEVVFASSTELVKQACQIRYAVYCEEFGFEDTSLENNCLESDQFDLFSNHYLIRHIVSDKFVGTIRIVSPEAKVYPPLPLGLQFSVEKDSLSCHPEHYCSSTVAEISRLAVLSEFRNRTLSTTEDSYLGRLPIVMIALYIAVAVDFQLNPERDFAFLLVEPRLVRHLKALGICFEKIGPIINYKGKRAPYVLRRENWDAGFNGPLLDIYDSLLFSLGQQGVGEVLSIQQGQYVKPISQPFTSLVG